MNLKLSKSKFRVVLTEILPYERPLFYSNRFYARFLKYYDVAIEDNCLVARRHTKDEGLDDFLALLSGKSNERTNYSYAISKDGLNKGRNLTVMHPFHQVKTMEFYDRYSRLIMAFCSKSKFSIRYPSRISSQIKWSSKFDKVIDDDADEEKTFESAKSYFHYEKVNNISKFYDNYRFLNIEKNFEYLLKIDIEKCFDSIDPERLSELVYNNGISVSDDVSQNDFLYDFIRLHRDIRLGGALEKDSALEGGFPEKGIIIGPEVSRLFAEIFLQQIDRRVEVILKAEHDMQPPKDYAFCRYVDDGFIAANSLENLRLIIQAYSQTLNEFNLKLKLEKIAIYKERPFIDDLSLIKSRLSSLIDKTFENRLSTFQGFQKVQEGRYDIPTHHSFKKFVSELRGLVAETALTSKIENKVFSNENDFSTITTLESHSRYKDITPFVLGTMERNLLNSLKDFNDLYREYSEGYEKGYISDCGIETKEKYESEFRKFCIELIESLLFIFNSDMRMATSISVVRMLDIIQRFVRGKYIFRGNIKSLKFKSYLISEIDEKISSETIRILRHKSIGDKYGLMELLNLLELQHLMFPRNRISEGVVLAFLERNSAQKQFHFFTVFQLMHFTQGKNQYAKILDYVRPWLSKQYKEFVKTGGADTESLLTVLEVFCAPKEYKMMYEMSELIGNHVNIERINLFLGRFKSMFINWEKYSAAEELAQRKGLNVY